MIADLTVDGAADSLVRAALDRWGRVDVLVNNAGMTSVTAGWDTDDDVAEMSLAAWDAALARNLTTAFLMCRSVLPLMTAAGYGRIVSIGSTTGTVNAMPGQSTYTAAKAGLVGLSRALALEVVGNGVTVNVVAPGYISTDSQLPFEAAAAAAGPIGRSGTPAEIAACVLFLAHESASFVTGTVAWLPTAAMVCRRRGHGPEFTTAPAQWDSRGRGSGDFFAWVSQSDRFGRIERFVLAWCVPCGWWPARAGSWWASRSGAAGSGDQSYRFAGESFDDVADQVAGSWVTALPAGRT